MHTCAPHECVRLCMPVQVPINLLIFHTSAHACAYLRTLDTRAHTCAYLRNRFRKTFSDVFSPWLLTTIHKHFTFSSTFLLVPQRSTSLKRLLSGSLSKSCSTLHIRSHSRSNLPQSSVDLSMSTVSLLKTFALMNMSHDKLDTLTTYRQTT